MKLKEKKKKEKLMANPLPQLHSLNNALPPLISKKIEKKEVKKISEEEDIESSNSENEDNFSEEESHEEKKEGASREIDKNASFFATFVDGSSLRYLIEYLRLTSLEGTLVFTKDYITYQKEDEDKTIFNDVKIKTYELTDYEFNSLNPEISATINLSELRNKTRTVGKKEQLDIYRRPEEPSNFYIQVRSQEKSPSDNPVFYCMNMKSESVNLFKLPEYSRGKRNPNCTIYQSDFSKVCKALVTNKCIYTEFIGYEKGIIIKGYGSDGKIIMIKEYGKCKTAAVSKTSTSKSIVNISDKNTIKPQVAPPKLNVRDADEIERFRVHISNIKAFSKINGFSSGAIKIYIEKGSPLMLVSSISSYGKIKILVRSS